MTLQQTSKKKKIYIYFFLLIFLSTIFNFNIKIFFEKNFKIINLENNDNLLVYELNNLINQNILKLNKNEIYNYLENYPILNSFKINKVYPNKLKIELIKTKHLAKIYYKNEIFFIGENGKLFQDDIENLKIPMIQGDVNIEIANKFLNLLKKTSFDLSEIKFLNFFPSGRWDIIFYNNRIIKLPRKNVFKLINKAELLLKDQNFDKKIIDLRINNKIILSDE